MQQPKSNSYSFMLVSRDEQKALSKLQSEPQRAVKSCLHAANSMFGMILFSLLLFCRSPAFAVWNRQTRPSQLQNLVGLGPAQVVDGRCKSLPTAMSGPLEIAIARAASASRAWIAAKDPSSASTTQLRWRGNRIDFDL